MVVQSPDSSLELQRAFDILKRHWEIAWPTAIASLAIALFVVSFILTTLAGIIGVVAAHNAAPIAATIGASFLTYAFLALIAVVFVALIANAMVVEAAECAWHDDRIDWRSIFRHAVSKLPALIVATFLAFLIMLIPMALTFVIVGIPLILVVGFFLIYTLPSIVIGGHGGGDAIAESFRLAKDHAGPTLVAFAGIVISLVVAQFAHLFFAHIPLVGFLIAFAVGGLCTAYAALVSVRFYTLLREGSPISP